jgi:predicted acyl esterase
MDHGSYDSFWQVRTPVSYLKHVKPSMMVVGGFFDQEDLYGALKTHSAIEKGGLCIKTSWLWDPGYMADFPALTVTV